MFSHQTKSFYHGGFITHSNRADLPKVQTEKHKSPLLAPVGGQQQRQTPPSAIETRSGQSDTVKLKVKHSLNTGPSVCVCVCAHECVPCDELAPRVFSRL